MFFFKDTAPAEIYPLSLHDALPISSEAERAIRELNASVYVFTSADLWWALDRLDSDNAPGELYLTDAVGHLAAEARKSTRLNSSHATISYAVFFLNKNSYTCAPSRL